MGIGSDFVACMGRSVEVRQSLASIKQGGIAEDRKHEKIIWSVELARSAFMFALELLIIASSILLIC